ncbi:sugar porter family MFS transporter [Alicyclobacillus tolerans]|uniref:MFS transporter n=1 Tax=Alicyclobacillus tolerans TaxID=90970 RepID=UPI001F3AA8C0|nr:MFS transporter [Alicyclobacillus tolerans]MCF8567832.1 sugar porter family MFS transporter [Alicyclobacillus tolerans]
MSLKTVANQPVVSTRGILKWAALLVALGEFIDGYDLLVMGAAMLFLKPAFHLSPSQAGLLSSSAFVGAAVGLFFFGPITDRLGRRTIFIVNLMFFVGFSILSAFITNTWELFLTRFFVGLAVGADIPASTAFLAEIAPAEKRGRFLGTLPNLLWVAGAITATILGISLLHTGNNAWRWMFATAAIPSFLVLVGRQALPESPRWLIRKGDVKGAEEACRKLGIPMPEVSHEANQQKTRFVDLFSPKYRRRSIVVSLVFGLNTLAGPITTLAVPYILKFGGLMSNRSSLLFSLAIYGVDILGLLTGFFLIEKLNRRTLAYLSGGCTGLLAIVMGIIGFKSGILLIVVYLLLAYSLWCGLAALVWVWGSELFPTHLRGAGQGLTNGVGRLGIVLTSFIVPMGIASLGVRITVVLFAIPLFILILLVATHPMFDTNGKTLESISD